MRATVICRGQFIDGLFRADNKSEMTIQKGDVCVFYREDKGGALEAVGPEYVGAVWLAKVEADA